MVGIYKLAGHFAGTNQNVPQIIIFGYTFELFKNDLIGLDTEPIYRDDDFIHVYEKDGMKLLDVYHPNQRKISRGLYIDSIIKQCL